MKPNFRLGKDCNLGDLMNLETNFVRILFGLVKWFQKWIMLPKIASEADIFIVIGTSMQVYPAAGLIITFLKL